MNLSEIKGLTTLEKGRWLRNEGLPNLRQWVEEGLNLNQIAIMLEVSSQAIYRWRDKHEEVAEATANAKETVDLSAGLAYRVIFGYSVTKRQGIVCASYDTPDEAWNDKRIHSNFGGLIASEYQYCYSEYLRRLKLGRAFHTHSAAILYCRISKKGGIIPVVPK